MIVNKPFANVKNAYFKLGKLIRFRFRFKKTWLLIKNSEVKINQRDGSKHAIVLNMYVGFFQQSAWNFYCPSQKKLGSTSFTPSPPQAFCSSLQKLDKMGWNSLTGLICQIFALALRILAYLRDLTSLTLANLEKSKRFFKHRPSCVPSPLTPHLPFRSAPPAAFSPQVPLEEWKMLFDQPVHYETYRQHLLTYRTNKQEFLFNHYGYSSFLALTPPTEQKMAELEETQAGIVTYQAIVDLYVNRLIKHHPILKQEKFLSSLQMVALGIALKISHDDLINNADFFPFLRAVDVDVKKYGQMEAAFLKAIDWNVSTEEILNPKD